MGKTVDKPTIDAAARALKDERVLEYITERVYILMLEATRIELERVGHCSPQGR